MLNFIFSTTAVVSPRLVRRSMCEVWSGSVMRCRDECFQSARMKCDLVEGVGVNLLSQRNVEVSFRTRYLEVSFRDTRLKVVRRD